MTRRNPLCAHELARQPTFSQAMMRLIRDMPEGDPRLSALKGKLAAEAVRLRGRELRDGAT